jgi:Na+/H+-dicarboxylate symporter
MSHRNIKLINVIIMPLCFGFLALVILSIRKAKALKRQSGG